MKPRCCDRSAAAASMGTQGSFNPLDNLRSARYT